LALEALLIVVQMVTMVLTPYFLLSPQQVAVVEEMVYLPVLRVVVAVVVVVGLVRLMLLVEAELLTKDLLVEHTKQVQMKVKAVQVEVAVLVLLALMEAIPVVVEAVQVERV
jgi:hypothetical protein